MLVRGGAHRRLVGGFRAQLDEAVGKAAQVVAAAASARLRREVRFGFIGCSIVGCDRQVAMDAL